MNSKTKHTAILFFSRSAKEEAFSKRIDMLSEKAWNYELYRKMIAHTLSVAQESRMEVLFFDEVYQCGHTFGERLAHAFSDLFSKGYTSVISIGNDCPMLSSSDLIAAQKLLEQGKNVIGPTKKGGTYLIGMLANSFHKKTFAQLAWNTSSLYTQLCKELKDVSLLFPKNDINSAEDLQYFVNHEQHYLARLFKELVFGSFAVVFIEAFTWFLKSFFYNKPLRAPPAGLIVNV